MLPRRSARNQNKNIPETSGLNVSKKPKETKPRVVKEENANNTKVMKTKSPGLKKENLTIDEPPKKKTKPGETDNAQSIYEFVVTNIYGDQVTLEDYKGHVCILVNVASRCGHTKSNYEQLVELHEKYSEEKGLKILAFPCNQFGKQEPGDAEKICEFVAKKNVKFDMFDKVDVNGKNAHPLWTFMKSKIAGPKGNNIDWNFTKFIVDKDGNVVERHKPAVKPLQLVESLKKYW